MAATLASATGALKRGLDKDASDDVFGEAELERQHKMSAEMAAQGAKETAERLKAREEERATRSHNMRDLTANINAKELVAKLPVGKEAEEEARRQKLFASFDVMGNNCLSLGEVNIGLHRYLELGNDRHASSHTSAHLRTPPHTSSHLLTPPHTSSHPLTPSHTFSQVCGHPLLPLSGAHRGAPV